MEKIKFGKLFKSLPKSSLSTNDGSAVGKYPFFTSSNDLKKKTDTPIYYNIAIIIGDGGSANINYCDTPFATNSHCYVYSSDKVNIKYVYYFLKSKIYLIQKGFKGAGIKNISKKYIEENIEIDVPTLDEQNRIVTILDKIEIIINKRRQIISQLFDLSQSIFLQKFDRHIRNVIDYVNFSSVIPEIHTGWSPVCHNYPRSSDNTIAVLKQSAVSKRFFDSIENKELPENTVIKKQCFISKDDLLFSRKNTLDFVGSSAYIFDDVKNLLMPDTIFNLKYSKNLVSGIYLYYLFNDINFRKNIRELATGALVSMSNISKKNLFELKIPLPNLELQLKFENEIRLIHEKIANQNKSLNLLENLLKSLTQRIFSGQSLIDIETELEAIINAINLDMSDNENNINDVMGDMAYRQKLLDKLATQNFSDITQYDKAKYIAFRLLKDSKNKINQEFDLDKKKLILT